MINDFTHSHEYKFLILLIVVIFDKYDILFFTNAVDNLETTGK